jgi:hypothetical protein
VFRSPERLDGGLDDASAKVERNSSSARLRLKRTVSLQAGRAVVTKEE